MNKLVIDTGKRIKYARNKKGYSTQELAKLLDVSPGLINNIENSKTDTFNLELLYKLSNILDLSVVSIISSKIDVSYDSFLLNFEDNSSYQKLDYLLSLLFDLTNKSDIDTNKTSFLIDKLISEINYYNKINTN